MKTFTIDRLTWHRGQGISKSCLLLNDGTRCCLGHVAKQLGNKDENVKGILTPKEVPGGLFPSWMIERSTWTNDIGLIIVTNDEREISDHKREETLKSIFAKHDIKLEFIN